MTLGNRLKKARQAKKWTQKELAEHLSVKHNSISNWENDINKPDPNTIELLCGLLDISPNYLLNSTSDDFSPAEKLMIKQYRELTPHGKEVVDFVLEKEYEHSLEYVNPNATTRLVPYFYKLASAGTGQIIFDTPPTKSIEIPSTYTNVDYALGVNGDSMSPDYEDGDTLLVEMTNSIEKGEVGIFQVDSMCYVKKLGDGELISINKNYENIRLNETSSCLGRVIDKL